ncbi:hypothetical protein D3C78_908370 [compost metagenome]
MKGLDQQRTARNEQGVHRREQRDDVLVQQGEVGADQVVIATDVYLGRSQRIVTGLMHRRTACCPRCFDQGCVAIHPDRLDAPFGQGTQQPALTTAEIEHMLGLAAQHGQEDGLVGDFQAAFDGAATDRFDPGAGVVMPALQEGGFVAAHCYIHCGGSPARIGQMSMRRSLVRHSLPLV